MLENYKRALVLPKVGTETFFLWGPRQAGKSTLLHTTYPDALWIDLLKTDEYRRFMQNPELLREVIKYNKASFIVIDEIQKVTALLNEVHWLLENSAVHFALCGSSARKIRKGNANLLGGRGITHELYGFSAYELGKDFELDKMLNNGYLPVFHSAAKPERIQSAYVSGYLKDEIAAEGLVRNLPGYSQFLNMAALSDSEVVNYSTIARDTGVSSQTIRGYFEILEDTLLGRFLPAYRFRPKRRIATAPKFYFHDIGIVNFLARRGSLQAGSELYGKAFENWVFHELYTYNMYRERYADFFFWHLAGGTEVDFIINHIDCAIDCKATQKVHNDHLKGLRQLRIEHPEVKKLLIVSLDQKNRRTEDGIDIVCYHEFLRLLWDGELF
jgi:predicted AAA+ superfamily ATPase